MNDGRLARRPRIGRRRARGRRLADASRGPGAEQKLGQAQSRDVDGDAITYEVSPLPRGASLDDQQGEFRWTPPASRAGDEIEFELIADDGEAQTIRRLTVMVRAAPSDDAGRGERDASSCPTDTGRCEADVRDTSSAPDVASPPEADVRADAREANDVSPRETGADTSSEASAPPSDGGCRCTTSGEDEMPPVSLPLGLTVALGAIRRSSRCRENSFTSFRSSGDSSSSA